MDTKKSLNMTSEIFLCLFLSAGNSFGHQAFGNLQIGHNHRIKGFLINIGNVFTYLQRLAGDVICQFNQIVFGFRR